MCICKHTNVAILSGKQLSKELLSVEGCQDAKAIRCTELIFDYKAGFGALQWPDTPFPFIPIHMPRFYQKKEKEKKELRKALPCEKSTIHPECLECWIETFEI